MDIERKMRKVLLALLPWPAGYFFRLRQCGDFGKLLVYSSRMQSLERKQKAWINFASHICFARRYKMNIVDKMARLAMIAHSGVNRNGPGNVPYIVHPHAVVTVLKDWGCAASDLVFTAL